MFYIFGGAAITWAFVGYFTNNWYCYGTAGVFVMLMAGTLVWEYRNGGEDE